MTRGGGGGGGIVAIEIKEQSAFKVECSHDREGLVTWNEKKQGLRASNVKYCGLRTTLS